MNIPDVTRRRFISQLGSGLSSAAMLPFVDNTPVNRITDFLGVTDPLLGKVLYRDVLTYDRMGEHRTATVVDDLTGLWMERHLRELGFTTEQQPFSVPHDIVLKTSLLIGTAGQAGVEAFPLWPVHFVNTPIVRPLVAYSADNLPALNNNIALINFPFSRSGLMTKAIDDLVAAADKAGAVAVVGITEGPTGLLTALNPTVRQAPRPIPVILVGPRDQAVLQRVADRGEQVTLLVTGQRSAAGLATNIMGRQVRQVGAPWVVISTPISGWFSSGGERGPGIAMWRALARLLAARWPMQTHPYRPLNYLFLATTGHEMNGLGMQAFLASNEVNPDNVLLWFHLGAWLSSYGYTTPDDGSLPQPLDTDNKRFLFASGISESLLTPLKQLPGIIRQYIPVGEVSLILDAGFDRCLTITGRNVPHHTRLDTAACTGPEKLEPVARNIAYFLSTATVSLR